MRSTAPLYRSRLAVTVLKRLCLSNGLFLRSQRHDLVNACFSIRDELAIFAGQTIRQRLSERPPHPHD